MINLHNHTLIYTSNMTSVADAVVPGQRLGHVQEYNAGAGTYALQDFLYASVVGLKQILRTSDHEV